MSDVDDDTIELETEQVEQETIAPAKPVDVNDVDASWDGTGSLDQHRQKAFAELNQRGFGNLGKAKSDGE